jgi:hypothetical protein
MMEHDAVRWALLDLIKLLDVVHEGRLHGDLARIARTLGVELSEPVEPLSAFAKAKKAMKN